ncbi:hypothetical protein [Paenibacillus sp. WLX2291]|uniref:hypothetical protein n=1 Tax=Paenibacillus sp. WLX2291 TaxID=3296934 RepID=UPI0039843D2B
MKKNCNYFEYWETEFNTVLILISTLIKEPSDKIRRYNQKIIKKTLQNVKPGLKTDMKNYLKLLRLGSLIYAEDFEKSVIYNKRAYLESKEYSVDYELSKINYSCCLITLGEYEKAVKILEEPCSFDINLINKDTYLSYENNLLIARFMSNVLSPKQAYNQLFKLLKSAYDFNSSDATILRNNLAAIMLISNPEESINELIELSKNQDLYHSFYAKHNLIYRYFIGNQIEEFEDLVNDISYDFLLKNYVDFFSYKFNTMRSMMNINLSHEAKNQNLMRILKGHSIYSNRQYSHYSQPILYGGLERWFE